VEIFVPFSNQDSQTTCQNNNGHYIGGSCNYYYAVSSICVKVSQRNGKLGLDYTYGGPGCYYSSYPGSVGQWLSATYSKIPYSSINQGYYFDFSKVVITMRHASDPFIYAEYITQGSLSFGLSPGEKAMIGAALMGIGGFFMLPCCIFVAVFTICYRRRHHHHYSVIH